LNSAVINNVGVTGLPLTKCCRSPWLESAFFRYSHILKNLKPKKVINQRQGTFLHQARRAKVQERRQHETLYVILDKQSASLKFF